MEYPVDPETQVIVDGLDLLHSKQIGKAVMNNTEFEHDPFIDDLDPDMKYPEDAP
jgi:hypothetical protein